MAAPRGMDVKECQWLSIGFNGHNHRRASARYIDSLAECEMTSTTARRAAMVREVRP